MNVVAAAVRLESARLPPYQERRALAAVGSCFCTNAGGDVSALLGDDRFDAWGHLVAESAERFPPARPSVTKKIPQAKACGTFDFLKVLRFRLTFDLLFEIFEELVLGHAALFAGVAVA